MTEVVFVNMPLGLYGRPNLGLSLLQAELARRDIKSKILYPTIKFAQAVGVEFYDALYATMPYGLVGEWLFSEALFGKKVGDDEAYKKLLRGENNPAIRSHYHKLLTEPQIDFLFLVREQIGLFLNQCLQEVLSYSPKVVGFSSMFEQHTASLALAKLIKARKPQVKIILGGPNCEGVMGAETARQFKFVDAVVSGEADLIIGDLIDGLLRLKPVKISLLPGVYTQKNASFWGLDQKLPGALPVEDMDSLPVPDFVDFTQQWNAVNLPAPAKLFFETARGCWWGKVKTCTFCGLNGETMKFRSKSPERALQEITHLATRWNNAAFTVVDNILDQSYFKTFLPALADSDLKVDLFYEVKSNLTKQQVGILKRAGVSMIQPGIESLSTPVLGLMRKGVRALRNIALLKHCKEIGIGVIWNILFGFPGERPEDYDKMAAIMPLLTHLAPPLGTCEIILQRFSPNFERAEEFGFTDVQPFPAYKFVYPFKPEVVNNLAYHFAFKYAEPRDPESYTASTQQAARRWRAEHETAQLTYQDDGEALVFTDTRACAIPHVELINKGRELYLACDEERALKDLKVIDPRAPDLLDSLCAEGLMLREGDSFLSLAVKVNASPDV